MEAFEGFVQEFYVNERNLDEELVVICYKLNQTDFTWSRFLATHTGFSEQFSYPGGSRVTKDILDRAEVRTALPVLVPCSEHDPDAYAEASYHLRRMCTISLDDSSLPMYAICDLRDSMLQVSFALDNLDEKAALWEDTSRRPSLDLLTTT